MDYTIKRSLINSFNFLLKKIKPNWELVGPTTYDKNGLFTVDINSENLEEAEFLEAFDYASSITGEKHPGPWRVYICVWAATRAAERGSEIVECGVFKGFTSLTILKYLQLKFGNDFLKPFHLIDSFEGIRLDDLLEGENSELALRGNVNKYNNMNYSDIKHSFKDFSNVKLVKGFIPECLSSLDINNIGYLHIDLNNAMPEVAALEYFWPNLNSGAVVVLDDYNWCGRRLQKQAIDKFCKAHNVHVLSLPTGTGIIIK